MSKQNIKQGNGISMKQKVFIKIAEARIDFRGIRIKHSALVLLIIWSRIVSGFCINISLTTQYSGRLYKILNLIYSNFFLSYAASTSSIFNTAATGMYSCFALLIIGCHLSSKSSARKAGIIISIIHYSANPLIIRYLITIGINGKQQTMSPISRTLCVLSVLCNLLIVHSFKLISHSSHPRNQNLLVCNKNMSIYIYELSLYILTIIISTLVASPDEMQDFRIILNLLHFLISLIPLYGVCRQFRYHNHFVESIYCLGSCFQVSISAVSFVSTIVDVELITQNMEILMISLTLFLFLGARQFISHRNNQVILELHTQKTSPRNVKIYLNILSNLLLGNNLNILNSMKNQHQDSCFNKNCICKGNEGSQDVRIQMKAFLIQNKIKSILSFNSQNFQIVVFGCFFLLAFYGAFPDLFYTISSIRSKRQKDFLSQLEYQCFKIQIRTFLEKKKIISNAVSTQRIQQQDQMILNSSKILTQISASKRHFWLNLNKKIPEFGKIDENITQQMQLIKIMQQNVESIFNKLFNSFVLLELVCIYEICIKLKLIIPNKIKQGFRNIGIIKNQLIKMTKNQNFNIEKVMFQKSSVIFQSKIEKNNMGIILNVSKNITSVFGFTPNQIVGQNINEIMPKSMQKQHDVILESWRERVSWANIHKIRYVFAMTKDRVCFQSVIYLRIMQRIDSVNLLATFMKANDKDFMIINEQGVIDGIGNNLRNLLGQGLPKLPFSFICPQADLILSQAKKYNTTRSLCINMYHIKGLENLIDMYRYSKYQLQRESENNNLINQSIRTKQRCIYISAQIRPYRMGNLFFVILRLVQIHKPSIKQNGENGVLDDNDQIVQAQHQNEVCSYLFENDNQINGYENNSSIHTSNYDTEMPSQTIFYNLEQKFNQPEKFKNKCIKMYCFMIIILSIMSTSVSLMKYLFQESFNEQIEDHSKQATRFIIKSNCLSFANSRMENVYSNILQNNQIQYQINRSLSEMHRFQYNLQHEHSGLWTQNFQDPAILLRTMDWSHDNYQGNNILIDVYYRYYLDECKLLEQKYSQGEAIFSPDHTQQLLENNRLNFQQFVNSSFTLLKGNILGNLQKSHMISCLKVVLLSLLLLSMCIVAWKMKRRQVEQKDSINKVFLTISDYNCLQCAEYYKKTTTIFNQALDDYQYTRNIPQRVEKDLIQKGRLRQPLQQLQFQKDKYEKRRVIQSDQDLLRKLKLLLALFFAPFLVAVIACCVYENVKIETQTSYFNKYFAFMQTQKQVVQIFLTIKSIVLNSSEINELPVNFDGDIILKKKQQGLLNRNFINLVWAAEVLDPHQQLLTECTNQLPICSKILSQDQQLHSYLCTGNRAFPYDRLKLIQANSVIFEYLSNVYYSLRDSAGDVEEQMQRLKVVQEILTLKLTYIYKFLKAAENQSDQFREQKRNNYRLMVIFQLLGFAILILCAWYYSGTVCENMNRNGGKLLVVPQKVLRYTKGAMRYVEEVLHFLMD